jgi:GAF domain-containing protein
VEAATSNQDLGSFVRLSLDPDAATLLQNAAAHLAQRPSPKAMASTILDAAMTLTGADRGNVQIADPMTGELRILTYTGFDQEFLDYFAVVRDNSSACGRAASHRAQAIVADVDADTNFAPHRQIAAASHFRAVQSTPLIAADGHLVGMVSTHYPNPGAPPPRALELTRLYSRVAGESLARSLMGPATPHPEEQPADPPTHPEPSSTLSRTAALELADTVVRSLLSAGLSLAGAQSLINDGVASDRVAAAIDELDHALGGIRSAVLELHS